MQVQHYQLRARPAARGECSLGQDSSPCARTETSYTWARGETRCHGGTGSAVDLAVSVRCSMARWLLGLLHSSTTTQESRVCDLISTYHKGGEAEQQAAVVLPAVDPKKPLTLVSPCACCCPALWAWCREPASFVRAASKRTPVLFKCVFATKCHFLVTWFLFPHRGLVRLLKSFILN